MAWTLRRRSSDSAAAVRERERVEAEARRRRDRVAREARRERAAVRRRQVAGQLAAAALSWGFNAWLEGAMWFCLAGGLAVDYIGSYADLAATFGAFGYDGWVRWIMPLGIDLPVTASVLGQLLAGRWRCSWWVRVRLGVLTATTAPLTLAGNALRGAIDGSGHFTFHVELWMDLAAFAVPGLGVVLIGWVAAMMQGERAELTRRRLEGEAETAETAGTADGGEVAPAGEQSPDTVPVTLASPPVAAERTVSGRRDVGRGDIVVATETTALAAAPASGDGHGGDRATAAARPSPAHAPDMTLAIEEPADGHDRDREDDLEVTAGRPLDDPRDGHIHGHEDGRAVTSARPSGGQGEDTDEVAAMTAEEARVVVVRLVRRARRSGRRVTPAEVERVTGRGARQARRLLRQAMAETDTETAARRPRLLSSTAAPAAAVEEV